jgi:hypothetical protein
MSYYLIDFTKKIDNFSFDDMVIGRKLKTDQDNAKYYIYYQTVDLVEPNEIYIRLPKLRLIYNLANHKYNQINIPIYPNYDLTNNFIEFIKKLESDIVACFSTKKTDKEFVSLISKKNQINTIKTNINDKVNITSNIDGQNITLNDFKINGQIEIVIKVSYIWSNKLKIGLSSQLYQIKYWAPPEQLNINFIDFEEKPQKYILKQPRYNLDEPYERKPVKVAFPPQIKFSLPSAMDLQKAIKSLKSTTDNNGI